MKKRNDFILAGAMVLSFGLCACAGSDSDTVDMGTVLETETIVQQVEGTSIENEESAEEIIERTTEIEEVSLYIPEGINMESTLPGQEWLDSFIGKVNEPVVVIYNDNTERKEVVQADSEVIINPDEDTIAVYWGKKG